MNRYACVNASGQIHSAITYGGEGPPPAMSGMQWVPIPDGVSPSGRRWDGAAFVIDTSPNADVLSAEKRLQRNRLLSDCDWTQMADVQLTGQVKAAWATYRNELRNLPDRPGFPNVDWPVPPA